MKYWIIINYYNNQAPPPLQPTPAIRPLPTRIRPETSRAIKAKAIRPLPIRIRPLPALPPTPPILPPPQPTQAIRPVPMRIRPLPSLPTPPILQSPRPRQAIRPLPMGIRPHPVPDNTPSPETYSNESSGSNVLEHQ